MAKLTTKELEKLIPSKIEDYGHHGNLTLIKRSNNKFLAYYPFTVKKEIPTTKGKTINSCLQRMHDELVNRGVIHEIVKKKKKKDTRKNRDRSKVKNPLPPKERLKRKLKVQERTLKNKF